MGTKGSSHDKAFVDEMHMSGRSMGKTAAMEEAIEEHQRQAIEMLVHGEGQNGRGVSLQRKGDEAYVTAYSQHVGADGTTHALVSQSTPLTARQLRTFATDAMALAAEMLVDGD